MARDKITVDYEDDGGARRVVLTSDTADFFKQAAMQEHLRAEKGEALVKALLEHGKGSISRVERFRNDLRNDGPGGEPAIEEFDMEGKPSDVARYKNGQRHNGRSGEPACEKFNSAGQRTYVVYYENGNRNDSPNGEPAEQVSDGQGNFVYIASYKNDKQQKMFTESEMRAYQEKVKKAGSAARTPAKKPAKQPKPGK